jgi:hypothetical protein
VDERFIAAAAASCVVLTACVDIFFDTDYAFGSKPLASDAGDATLAQDQTAPAIDAGQIDFCALDLDEAKRKARTACALLAACETPVGANATGRCLERALPAIGCTAARGQRVSGIALDYYRCLSRAKSCPEIEACVFGSKPAPTCGAVGEGGITQCLDSTRVDCPSSGVKAAGESCAGAGRICSGEGSYLGACTGSGGLHACTRTGCEGTRLHLCADGGKPDAGTRDDGFDCAPFGAGTCIEGTGLAACAPFASDGGAIGCTPTADVLCISGSVAQGCATGTQESIDCALFEGTCHPDAGRARAWDLARACDESPDAGGCSEDRCGATGLTACVRGHRIEIDCAAHVGPKSQCMQIPTADGIRAACSKP